ncbi:MAG: YitT family protein [Ruminococcus sp.]|nr:YitT family protein [Ruminococcus sp.]
MKLNKLIDYSVIIIGSVIYALSVAVFTSPNNIAPGGLTGVGILLNYLFSVPIGTFILIMNVPLFIIGYKSLGRKFVAKSLLGTVIVSLAIDLVTPFAVPYKGDIMLASIYGGILNGGGLALIFARGGSTGGTDIIASIVHKHFPQFSIGLIILVSDAIVVFVSALVYSSLESALYAAISIFVSSKLIDLIIYGTSRNNGKLMLIITELPDEILLQLLTRISRGVTVIDAVGGFSGNGKKLLLCALRPNQVFKANSIVKSVDNDAFIIITTANEVNGSGFVNKN